MTLKPLLSRYNPGVPRTRHMIKGLKSGQCGHQSALFWHVSWLMERTVGLPGFSKAELNRVDPLHQWLPSTGSTKLRSVWKGHRGWVWSVWWHRLWYMWRATNGFPNKDSASQGWELIISGKGRGEGAQIAFLFMSDSALSSKTTVHPEVKPFTEIKFSVYVDMVEQTSALAEQNYKFMLHVWWNSGKLTRDIWQVPGLFSLRMLELSFETIVLLWEGKIKQRVAIWLQMLT